MAGLILVLRIRITCCLWGINGAFYMSIAAASVGKTGNILLLVQLVSYGYDMQEKASKERSAEQHPSKEEEGSTLLVVAAVTGASLL